MMHLKFGLLDPEVSKKFWKRMVYPLPLPEDGYSLPIIVTSSPPS